jgi:acyl carrier protein
MGIKDDIRRFIAENFILNETENLGDEDSLLEKGIIDSTGVLELVAFIEEKYSINVEDEEMIPENLDSIHNIAEFLRRKLKDVAEPKLKESLQPSPPRSP